MKLESIVLAALVILWDPGRGYCIKMELDSFSGYHNDFSAYATVLQCTLGARQSKTISLMRGDAFYKGYFYAVDLGDTIEPLGKFLRYNTEDERDFGKSYSDSISAGCVGKKEKALVLFGDFGGNRADAMALRYNEFFHEYEYIDIRTHNFPELLYINKRTMLLIGVEEIDMGYSDAEYGDYVEKYVRYDIGEYTGGKGQTVPSALSKRFDKKTLPNPLGFTVTRFDLEHLEN